MHVCMTPKYMILTTVYVLFNRTYKVFVNDHFGTPLLFHMVWQSGISLIILSHLKKYLFAPYLPHSQMIPLSHTSKEDNDISTSITSHDQISYCNHTHILCLPSYFRGGIGPALIEGSYSTWVWYLNLCPLLKDLCIYSWLFVSATSTPTDSKVVWIHRCKTCGYEGPTKRLEHTWFWYSPIVLGLMAPPAWILRDDCLSFFLESLLHNSHQHINMVLDQKFLDILNPETSSFLGSAL